MTAPSPDNVADLLSAYVLDALDADEAASVDNHLQVCPACRAEADRLRSLASLFAPNGQAVPPELWWTIVAAVCD